MKILSKINSKEKIFIYIFFILSLLSIIYSYRYSRFLEINGWCGNDGLVYCNMSQGITAFEPYSRRTFLPYIVSLTNPVDIPQRFFDLNFYFCLVILFFAYKFQMKTYSKYKLVIFGIILTNPFIFRMLFSYPVLTDYLALMLILIFWFFFYFVDDRASVMIQIITLIILCFVRENISITLTLSLIILMIFQKKINYKIISLFIFSVIFTIVSFSQDKISNPHESANLIDVVLKWIIENFTKLDNFIIFSYLMILGLSPFVIMFVKDSLSGTRYKEMTIFIYLLTITSIFLGGDTSRIMLPSGILIILIFLSKDRSPYTLFTYLVLTLSLWDLSGYSDGTYESGLYQYGQRWLPVEVTIDQLEKAILTASPILFTAAIIIQQKIYSNSSRIPILESR